MRVSGLTHLVRVRVRVRVRVGVRVRVRVRVEVGDSVRVDVKLGLEPPKECSYPRPRGVCSGVAIPASL